jgi:hypothetical protein
LTSGAFRVTIDRHECISRGAYWSACAEFFEESLDDGFSQVLEWYRTDSDIGVG